MRTFPSEVEDTGIVIQRGEHLCGIPMESTFVGCEDSTLCHHRDASVMPRGVARGGVAGEAAGVRIWVPCA